VLLNRLEFELSPRHSIDAPRFSQQWFPDRTTVEKRLLSEYPATPDTLRKMGHTITPARGSQGDAHSIFIDDDGTVHGIADQRRSGTSAGY
jgi:gamma-glutamyltranspeptidase